MAPSFSSSSSSPSSSSKSPPPLPPHHSPCFTPIQECERGELEAKSTPSVKRVPQKHIPTPLHYRGNRGGSHGGAKNQFGDEGAVSCTNCRPHPREKISVVPVDNNNGVNKNTPFSSMASPNGIFRSIFQSLTRRSPKSTTDSISSSSARDEEWKVAVAELSQKLILATRKRDEAVLEASKLKSSMAEIEKKLNKLEVYCHNLKSGLDECSGNNSNSPYRISKGRNFNETRNQDGGFSASNEKVIQQFLVSVSEARSSVRFLSKSLTMQLRHMGGKVYERISILLQPYDIKVSYSKNPKFLLFYLEALLNKAFFEDFESIGFNRNSVNQILNPIDRCEANYGSFNDLQGLTWEEVLNKGTRHFSEEFSKFCDRKMSEIVAMLGWNRAWPEPLLQAFFGASKSVWLVHLLAFSVHPGLQIFRVDKGGKLDHVYMEDLGGESAKNLAPVMVRIMVAPGFYVYNKVVKCKVICRYYNNNNEFSRFDEDKD